MHPYNTPANRSLATGREQQPSSQRNPPAGQGSAARTPRFLFGPSASQSAGPQFSSTPRFRLGDPSSQARDDIHLSDDGDDDHQSSPTRHAGSTSHEPRQRPSRSGDDILDDSDDSIPNQVVKPHDILSGSEENVVSRDIQSTRHRDEDELVLSSPSRPEAKRLRRVSPSPTKRRYRSVTNGSEFDIISSSPTEKPSSPYLPPEEHQPLNTSQHETEVGDELLTPPHRPAPSTPFQNLGRAKLQLFPSAAQSTPFTPNSHISNTAHATDRRENSHLLSQTPMPTSSVTPHPKPRFKFPATPQTADADKLPGEPVAPNPLSPLSLRSKRPGRPSKSSMRRPDFIAGGMASELRTWLFEIGTRQQTSTSTMFGSYQSSQLSTTQQQQIPKSTMGIRKMESENNRPVSYRETFSVAEFKCSNVQHAQNQGGAFAGRPAPFIIVTPQSDKTGNTRPYDDAILLNPPIIRPVDTFGCNLRSGSRIGVRRRLAWDIELDPCSLVDRREDGHGDQDAQKLPASTWLVGVEWDILDGHSLTTRQENG